MRTVVSLCVLFVLSACSRTPPLPDGVVVDASMAPVPYTTEALAAHNTAGRRYVFRVDSPVAPPMRRTMAFDRVDDDGAWVVSTIGPWDGDEALADTTTVHMTWKELQDQAAFPAESTTRSWSTVTLASGEVACVLYTVDEGGGRVSASCFDPVAPGPPIVMSQHDSEQTVFTMTQTDATP